MDVKRPSSEEFLEIYKEKGFNNTKTAEYYGVSESAVRRWKAKFDKETSFRKAIDKEKDKIAQQVSKKLREQLTKEKGKHEYIMDSIKEIIKPLTYEEFPKLKVESTKIKSGVEEEVFNLVLSDLHIGKETTSYNSKVFVTRLTNLLNATLRLVEIQRKAYSIKKLVIHMVGDIVENENLFNTQPYRIDHNVLDQIFNIGIPNFISFFGELSKHFDEILILATPGNHGRLSKFNSPQTNFDTILYKALEYALQNIPNVKIKIATDFYLLESIAGKKFLLMHGSDVRGSMPYAKLLQAGLQYTQSLGEYDVMVVGHFHQAAMLNFQKKELIINGSMDTDCDFVKQVLKGSNKPVQIAFCLSAKRGITARWKIDLDKNYGE